MALSLAPWAGASADASGASLPGTVYLDLAPDGASYTPGDLALPGVLVELVAAEQQAAGHAAHTALTDEQGNFVLSDVAAGDYILRCADAGLHCAEHHITIGGPAAGPGPDWIGLAVTPVQLHLPAVMS